MGLGKMSKPSVLGQLFEGKLSARDLSFLFRVEHQSGGESSSDKQSTIPVLVRDAESTQTPRSTVHCPYEPRKHNKVITTMVIRLLNDCTLHIVLDLGSLIWGFSESCIRLFIAHFTTNQNILNGDLLK